MSYRYRTKVRKVRETLEESGFEPHIVELENTARSAREAAEALGVRVEQIVKSMIFRGEDSGKPVLVLAGGANRVNERKVSALLDEPLGKANAAFVREQTGFSIGGIPPVGHDEAPITLVDEDLLIEDEVWAAAGHTHAVFGIPPAKLVEITGGKVIAVS